jgi:hypothetical protein
MRNLLIYIGRWRNACGLLVVLRQEEKGENWLGESAMWPQMGSQPDWRSPQAYSAFRACSRGLAGAHKKTPNREWLGFEYWWSRGELNPRPQALRRQFYMLIRLIWI